MRDGAQVHVLQLAAHRHTARLRDLDRHLRAGQHAAVAGLGALRQLHLDQAHLRIGGIGDKLLLAEAAVVGYPHDIKGQGIYAYVTLKAGQNSSDDLRKELVAWVRKEIGPFASPDLIQFSPGLPKTRSGKIMRRILRKIAEGETSTLGDTSTLADPSVVNDLIEGKEKLFG